MFDVKFKKHDVNGSWHDDLDRLHGYRDALGQSGTTVQEAWCLYPGAGVGEQTESTPPHSAREPDSVPSAGGIGLLPLHPIDEASTKRLERLLDRWFPNLSTEPGTDGVVDSIPLEADEPVGNTGPVEYRETPQEDIPAEPQVYQEPSPSVPQATEGDGASQAADPSDGIRFSTERYGAASHEYDGAEPSEDSQEAEPELGESRDLDAGQTQTNA